MKPEDFAVRRPRMFVFDNVSTLSLIKQVEPSIVIPIN